MAGRPPKSAAILKIEGKSHRTKAEMAIRTRGEENSLTGYRIREEASVKQDPAAHQEFLRVTRLLRIIGKNDAMFAAEINTYCRLKSELDAAEKEREDVRQHLEKLTEWSESLTEFEEIMAAERLMNDLRNQLHRYDQTINTKRRMRIQIEDKNMMNIISSLRSIPKTVEKKKNPLAEALSG